MQASSWPAFVGGTRLDLSEAQLAAPEGTLTTVSLIGGTQIMVPPGIRVEASGFSLVGGARVEGGPEPGPPRRPSTSARSRWSAGSEFSAAGGVGTGDRGVTGARSGRTGGPSAAPSGDRGVVGPDTLSARPGRRPRLVERRLGFRSLRPSQCQGQSSSRPPAISEVQHALTASVPGRREADVSALPAQYFRMRSVRTAGANAPGSTARDGQQDVPTIVGEI